MEFAERLELSKRIRYLITHDNARKEQSTAKNLESLHIDPTLHGIDLTYLTF